MPRQHQELGSTEASNTSWYAGTRGSYGGAARIQQTSGAKVQREGDGPPSPRRCVRPAGTRAPKRDVV